LLTVTRGGDQELGITSRAGSREREQEVALTLHPKREKGPSSSEKIVRK
jgi:hypothetical protein